MQIEERTKKSFLIPLSKLFFVVFSFFVATSFVHAATLSVFPSSGTHTVGDTFSITVSASSPGQALNAIDGILSFQTDRLEALSVFKEGSILNLWAQEPIFSNTNGTVVFSGIVLNPGFTGFAGKVVKVNFRVKKSGNAAVVFSSGSVLANDGMGTSILTGLSSAQFTLLDGKEVKKSEPISPVSPPVTKSKTGVPMTPTVSSSTHSDQNRWYNKSNALFQWNLPADIIGVRIVVDDAPLATPHVKYSVPIGSKEENNISDGVWYFHIQFENKRGLSEVSHFRFQIDTQPPAPFTILFPNGNSTDDTTPTVFFSSGDSLSGISSYKVRIGKGDFFDVPVNTNSYTFPPQKTGTRDIEIVAYDNADNMTSSKTSFTILPSPFIRALKTFATGVFLVVLILLIIFGIYFIILRIWRYLVLLRHKLQNETKEMSATSYKSLRKNVDDYFANGNYLGALSGYKRLQERTSADKQSELNERIILSTKFLLAEENFQKAKVAANHGKWIEAQTLLNESEHIMDSDFKHHEEVQKLFSDIRVHIEDATEEDSTQKAITQKKLTDAEFLVEETKKQLAQQQAILMGEKAKLRGLEEKSRSSALLLQEKELAYNQTLESVEAEANEAKSKLTEVWRVAEETKVQFAREQTLLKAERAKSVQAEEENKRLTEVLREREVALVTAETNIYTEVAEAKKKLAEVERSAEETKAQFLYEQNRLNAEKNKYDLATEENKKLTALFQEKEFEFETALSTAEAQIFDAKKKLADVEMVAEEIRQQLAHEQSILKTEKTNREQAEEENKKLEALLQEKEIALQASTDKVKEQIEGEVNLKKALEQVEEQFSTTAKKLSETEHLAEEVKKQLILERELLVAEKAKRENFSAALSKFLDPKS